ncbi:hypothetical protein TNCV_1955851 [Trichonephila clavipes]|nr:hypothetical protein TNCV_1955851 [Trichonephila clavipes]
MLIHSASSQPGLVRGTVVWLENSITVRITEQHKRMERKKLIDHDSALFAAQRETVEERSDEAHFWLNGYVNKQNCRIWSEANPQVYVETPLHPEKLTVSCALWAGGILLQKR